MKARQCLWIPILLAALLLAGCAGTPEEIVEPEPPSGPDPQLLEQAQQLIDRGSPQHLREAAQLLRGPAQSYAEAEEQLSLTLAVFDLLYPELVESGYLSTAGSSYAGPYREILDRARSGRAASTGPLASGLKFFDYVAPALFLARLDTSEAGEVASDLNGYLDLLERAEAMDSSSVLPPYLRGRIYQLQGKADQAIALYRSSVDRADSFYPGRHSLAVLLLQEGQAGKAVPLLEEISEQLPEDLVIRYNLADAYYRSGQLEAASKQVAQVLMKEPDNPQTMLLRARVLIAEGNWTQGLRLLNLMLYKHADNREAYLLMARILHEQAKDPESALEVIIEAENQFPDSAEFPELAGRIYLESGRSGEGLNQLQRALDLEPGRVSTLRLLLSNAMRMQRWLQGAIYLSEILEQEQSREDLLQAIEIYKRLGDPAQVLFYAEQLYQSSSTEENLVVYAQALFAEGQNDRAAALVEQGLEQSESVVVHSTLLTLKASAIAEEAPEQALALIREALLEHPQNYSALIKIAELYVKERELRKASLYLKQAIALDPNNVSLRVQLQSIEKALDTENTR